MSAVASFASPSPSRMKRIRSGSCIRLAIESGATASVGETIAPSKNPTGQGKFNNQWLVAATAIVVNATQPTANSTMGRRLNRNSRQLMDTANHGLSDQNRTDFSLDSEVHTIEAIVEELRLKSFVLWARSLEATAP